MQHTQAAPFVGCEDLSLTHNLTVDPRLIGMEATLVPFAANVSSQRMNMFSSNIVQAMIINGREQPRISTGFESQFIDYTFNPTRRNQDIRVLAVIPKYQTNVGPYPIRDCHSYTVVYIGEDDHLVNYFNLETYTKGADGFGYTNIVRNKHLLRSDIYVTKDTTFATSPAVDGNKYMLGTNANVAYMSLPEVAEDAFIISQSLADRLESTAIQQTKIEIGPNAIPLNIHGSEDDYKIMPDIGETVREDGILCAVRTISDHSIITDTRPSALTTIQMHDDVRYAKPGAIILDIEVYINDSKKIKTPPYVFTQLKTYWNNILTYYQTLHNVYLKCSKEHMDLSPDFKSLVSKTMEMLTGYGQKVQNIPKMGKNPLFVIKREPIEFIYAVVTYQYPLKVTKGFKLTGRDGAKGVIAEIWANEDMPVDDFGNRADMVIAPETTVNRMNPSQLWEHWINYVSNFVNKQAQTLPTREQAYDHIRTFIAMINPQYANIVDEAIRTTRDGLELYLEDVYKRFIMLVCPPFLETIQPQLAIDLKDKFNVPLSQVEFNLRDTNGNLIRRVRTRKPVVIGSKYVYLLCKVPHARSSGISNINQLKLPVRPHAKAKSLTPISMVPHRTGEDEIRQILMATNPDCAARFLSLYSNSHTGVEAVADAILTADNPSNIQRINMTTEQLNESNRAIGAMQHMLSGIGLDLKNVSLPEPNLMQEPPYEDQ
jgi:hypothetical protein